MSLSSLSSSGNAPPPSGTTPSPTTSRKAAATVIVIAGPTAVGKSDVAAQLTRTCGGMIVSADSVQAYPGVQIGANKPSALERQTTPHLLVDIVDKPDTVYNVAEWRRDALYAIRNLLQLQPPNVLLLDDDHDKAGVETVVERKQDSTGIGNAEPMEAAVELAQGRRNRIDAEIAELRQRLRGLTNDNNDDDDSTPPQPIVPIVVGGTMMYLQWLVHGRPDAVRPTKSAMDKALHLITKYQTENDDWEGAVQIVEAMGDNFVQQVSKLAGGRDWYRLRRMMEVGFTAQEMMKNTPTAKNKRDGDKNNDNDKNQNNNNNADKDNDEDMTTVLEQLYNGQREGGLLNMNGLDVRCFFLCPEHRMSHCHVIDERCEDMIVQGLIPETTQLAMNHALPDMAARAIGYRQTLDYLLAMATRCNDSQEEEGGGGGKNAATAAFVEYVEKFASATRNYSKRQMQWFRRDDQFVFVTVPDLKDDDDYDDNDKRSDKKIDISHRKTQRAIAVAKEIERMVQMPRDQFDQLERLSTDSTSSQTRARNEAQGKGMRVYQFRRKILLEDSPIFRKVLEQVNLCTQQFQSNSKKRRRQTVGGEQETVTKQEEEEAATSASN